VSPLRRAGAVVLLSAVSLYLTAGRGVSPGDESWFLLVAKRVAEGDDLYRDVFYSPLPLAVYLTAAPVAVFGAHIAIVEVLIALAWACTALIVVAHARRVTGSAAVAALALMALVVVAPPQRNSLYTPLAMLLLLVCMLIATRLVEAEGNRLALLAGVVAGLSFASKQTVGAGALAALLLCIGLAPRARVARGVAAFGGFAAVTTAVALVLALSGVLSDAVRVGFTGKGEYLAHGSLSYTGALSAALRFLPSEPAAAFDTLPLLLAPVVAALLVVAAGRRALSATVLVPAAFALAALTAAYPRLGATHVGWANPAVIACAVAAVGPHVRGRRLLAVTAAPLAVGCAVAATLAPLAWAQDQLTISALPAFEGMPISLRSEDDGARFLRAIRPRESVFFVTERAGFLYLVTDARNPTPYDVPAASNIGTHELAVVETALRSGALDRACLGGQRAWGNEPSLQPLELERNLRRDLRPKADLGICVLYARR